MSNAAHVLRPESIGFGEMDYTAQIEATREVLQSCVPHALEIWEHIIHLQRVADGLHEEEHKEIARLRIQRDDYLSRIGHFDRAVDNGERATASQVKQRQRWQEMIEKTRAKMIALQEKKPSPRFSVSKIDEWAARSAGKKLFKPRVVTVATDVDKARRALELNLAARADFAKQRHDADLAPLTLEEARVKATAEIERLAKAGAPNVSALFRQPKDQAGRRRQGPLRWVTKGIYEKEEPDAFVTFVWLHKATLLKAVDGLLREQASESALSAQARRPIIAEIDARLRDLEYEESALVRSLEMSSRFAVERRPDMSVLAALQIEEDGDAPQPMDFG